MLKWAALFIGKQPSAMKSRYLFLLILFCWISGTTAQDLAFRKLTSNQGLSHNTVYAISQDEKGQMWFATREGLNRYDSYQIKHYYIKDTLANASPDKINTLLCDQGKIYLATEDGLFIYHQKTDHIARSTALTERLNILCLYKDSSAIYAGTSTGLYRIENQKSRLIRPKKTSVRAMGKFSKNHYLISTRDQLQVIDGTGTVRRAFNSRSFPQLSRASFEIFNIYNDGKGRPWICTNQGLFYFDQREQQFIRLNFAKNDTREAGTVRSITSSGKDLLYIGTEQGMYVYNRRTGHSENYGQSFENDPKKLNDKAVYSAFMAKDGSVWLGTYFGGVNYIPAGSYAFKRITAQDNGRGLSGKAVSQMMEDSLRNIWIGTEDGGITIYNPAKGSYSYINKTSRPFYLNVNNVHAIHNDGYGHIWVGTFLGGLHKFDLKNQTTTIYTNNAGDKSSLSSDNVYAVYRDSRGKLWIGSQKGLDIYNYQKGNFSHFKPDIFSRQFIYDITEDSQGNMWFCTRSDGIYRFTPSSGAMHHYRHTGDYPTLTSNQIISLYKDSHQKLWFGSLGGGVMVYDIQKDQFTNYKAADGLPNNNVYGILEDKAGYVWLTTNRGLSKFDPSTGRFINYNNSFGLPSNQFNFKSYLKSSSGTLYFGTINGLCYFRPEDIASRYPLIPLIFTDFQLFNKSIVAKESSVLKSQIDDVDKITLPYSQNVFTIHYAGIDYGNPGSTNYGYYLKGFEDSWNYVGGKHSATYTNLSPGNYTFHVVALRADGAQKSAERTIQIRVTPPFYQTTVAYIIYTLLIILLIWLYTRFIKFLQLKKTEVQIERIEKEKTKELTQNRLNFFTFISHEFKTPLTLILASIEKFNEERGIEFKKNPELSHIKSSASVLFKLIQQLMEFRKMETGHNAIHLDYTDIIAFVKNKVFYFETVARSKNTTLSFQTKQGALCCYFDKDKVEKILFNIVSNALKNTENGCVTITVEVKKSEQNKEQALLTLCISDTGIGMTKTALGNIFNPFYTAVKNKEGTGIGLALVNSLVRYLDGTITIDSTLNKGTEVHIVLPVLLKMNGAPPKGNTGEKSAPIAATPFVPNLTPTKEMDMLKKQQYTLLLVEDNKELLIFLSNHFSSHYQVVTAPNGLAALKKVRKAPPDIIISDVEMPKMNGMDLCKAIKEDPDISYIPVILLSAWQSQDTRVDGLHTGADAYLGKPFNLRELELLVTNMIKSRVKLREHVISISELATNNLPSNNKHQEFLEKLSNVLEKRFSDSGVSIEDLAKDLHMSRTSLHLNLKKSLNKSATELLNEYRLKRAAVMLENDMPISEAAYNSGYNDPNYFSRVFKKHYMVTPATYRENKKKEK